jgi:hypothetical protein
MTIFLTALWLTGTGILSVLTLLCLSFTITDILNKGFYDAKIGASITTFLLFCTAVVFMLKGLI